MTKFGVGFSELANSYEAGVQAAREAKISAVSTAEKLVLCILFCTSRHEASEFSNGVKSILGEADYIGGFANGTISNDQFGYDGHQCIVGLLYSDVIRVQLFKEEGIAFNEFETGKKLFEQIAKAKIASDPQILLLFDAVNRQKGRFQMNYGAPLLEGAISEIKEWPNIVGARLMGDMKFKPTYQWFKNSIIQNAAIAAVFTGNIRLDVLRLDGCSPASSYHTVTKSVGATILEIDHKPALELVGNMLGPEVRNNLKKIKFFVTMGKNVGDKWDRKNSKYVNRMCVGVNPDTNGLIMAEMDMKEGTEFQFMRRGDEMDDIEENVSGFIEKIKEDNRSPLFACYLNCAGRASAYSQNNSEDAMYIQKAVNNQFPLLGIYEAGELAKIKGELQVFDWTGIFCLFSEKN